MPKNENLTELLERRFKLTRFWPLQEETIQAALSGQDVLLVRPTGGGKSLCYQLPASVFPGLTLVISPLVALIQDQWQRAKAVGLRAGALHSQMPAQVREQTLEKLKGRRLQILFVTPERFRQSVFWEALQDVPLSLLVVDEAHCISQWGHDFRPEYSRLGEIRERLSKAPLPVMALTATATSTVQSDIVKELRMREPLCLIDRPARANLALDVHEVYGADEKVRGIVGLRHQNPGPMVVYFSLIQTLQKASNELRKLGLSSLTYHGQMATDSRRTSQATFLKSDNELLLATPAFGLGVDKPNIRSVVHFELPGSIEAYFQEVGRAGRDGAPAKGMLLLDPDDVSIHMDFIKWANPEKDFIMGVYRILEKQGQRIHAEGLDFIRQQLNFYNSRDFRLETTMNLLERAGSIEMSADRRFSHVLEAPSAEWLELVTAPERKKFQNQKLLALVQWAQQNDVCRMVLISDYFGFRGEPACGHCDVCVRKHDSNH